MVFSYDTHDLKWYSHKYDANNISNCFYTRLQESLNKFCKLKTIQACSLTSAPQWNKKVRKN